MNSGQGTVAQEVADEIASSLVSRYRENRAKAPHHEQEPPVAPPNMLASIKGTWSGIMQTEIRKVPLRLTVDEAGNVHASIALRPATVQEKAEYRDEEFRAKITGISGLYERDPKKALDLDLQLFLRPGGVLNGGATTMPLSQPEWGVVTYFVQLTTKQRD